ncbi:uncharacterized protein [Drosophila virilis]|uniref:Uncharacterized protein, isoform A n=1 Tax=Drosophila virilis TaxID=7244 RepID=B4LMK9_DROVI|nr:uncharacterized protein LOC6626986 isoform X1 [Drosophila virilis]EDW59996.1 uncharacterized protein Dvir_GJ21120, isoform A [Drosophila virilis]
MATATITASTAAAALNATTSIVSSSYSSGSTTSTTAAYPEYGDAPYVPVYTPSPSYVYFYSGYAFYIVLLFLFVILMPFAIIMSSMQRKRQENARRLALQRERARREMEISVANNSTTLDNNSVCIQADNDMTILPKGMDLPPSYDDLNISHSAKQQPGNMGASTLTIATDLGCSNSNLAAALNEPPPDYQGTVDIAAASAAGAPTATISTTMVVSVTPRI